MKDNEPKRSRNVSIWHDRIINKNKKEAAMKKDYIAELTTIEYHDNYEPMDPYGPPRLSINGLDIAMSEDIILFLESACARARLAMRVANSPRATKVLPSLNGVVL